MILPDNKPDSILIYTDWLIDNDQEELALDIRKEAVINVWFYEIREIHGFMGSLLSPVGIGFLKDLVGAEDCLYRTGTVGGG